MKTTVACSRQCLVIYMYICCLLTWKHIAGYFREVKYSPMMTNRKIHGGNIVVYSQNHIRIFVVPICGLNSNLENHSY